MVKGMKFEPVSLIQKTVTRELKAIWEEAFSQALNLLYERCKSVEADRVCIE
jgi:hypothetical protein